MNAVRLKIRRTGSISPETPGGSFLRNRRSARIDAGASYPARIRSHGEKKHSPPPSPFSLSLLPRAVSELEQNDGIGSRGSRNTSRSDRVHIMQVHRRAAVLHLRRAFKTRRVLARLGGRLVILRSPAFRSPSPALAHCFGERSEEAEPCYDSRVPLGPAGK